MITPHHHTSFPSMSILKEHDPLVFFDGVCNFCDGTVNYILRKDQHQRFHFCALQAPFASKVIPSSLLPNNQQPDTVILYHEHRWYTSSDAILQIARLLGGMHRIVLLGYVVPRPIRDALYQWIAYRRYRWFGKKNSCEVPDATKRKRFLWD